MASLCLQAEVEAAQEARNSAAARAAAVEVQMASMQQVGRDR